ASPDHNPPAEPNHIRRVSVEDDQYLTIEWELAEIEDPVSFVLERSQDQGQSFSVVYQQAHRDPKRKYQDYQVTVDQSAYQYRAFTIDTCGDYTPVGRTGRNILLRAEQKTGRVFLNWTPYEGWEHGVESYLIEVFDEASAQYRSLAEVPGDFTYFEDQEVLDQPSSCYRITAYEQIGAGVTSLSNEACVIPDPKIFRPNAFTPNGDGINDEFVIKGSFVSTFHLAVYNRWGHLLFKTNNPEEGWDGTDQEGKPVPTGTYTYVMRGVGYSGQEVESGGTIQLVR
ncbi:MAG: gliding motility-associated C-terminal domain-containing protein, partial [Bacteroidota bacterium]